MSTTASKVMIGRGALCALVALCAGAAWAGPPGSQPSSQPTKAPGSQPSGAKITKPGAAPAVELPKDPFVRCALASKVAGQLKVKQEERRARINKICAPLFKEKACHDALKDILKRGGEPAFAVCARSYCDKLKAPKPGVCEDDKFRGSVQARAALIRRALIRDHGIKPLPLALEAQMGAVGDGKGQGRLWLDIQKEMAEGDYTERQKQMWGISFVLALMAPAHH